MFITDCFSDMIFFYFMFTHEQKRENLWILKNFVNWMRKRYGLKIDVIWSDNEMAWEETLHWLWTEAIDFKSSALCMQEQNDVAECSENVIMKKSWAMQISSNFPHDLWMKIVNSAVYLHNQISREAQNWKTSYEIFFFIIKNSLKKSQLVHLKVYECRAYVMTEDAQLK